MTAVDVNATGYILRKESSVGTPDTTAPGHTLEPNDITKLGATLPSARRQPISRDRMPRGSTVVDLDSGVEIAMDLTGEHLRTLLSYAMFATPKGRIRGVMYPSAVNADEYVVANGATVPVGTLIYAAGFSLPANNGLKLVAGVPSGTEVPADNLEVEATTVDQNATVEICGVQGDAGDLTLDANGDLLSTTLDFTTLGWMVGQILHLGDPYSGAAYRFATITDDQYAEGHGFVRIRAITAHKVTFDKNEQLDINGADAAALKTIRILFGEFYREYADDHANYLKEYVSIEAAMPELDGGVDAYLYPRGNLLDTLTMEFPLGGLAKMSAKWVGTDTREATTVRDDWTAGILEPRLTDPFNTTADWIRRRIVKKADATPVLTELKDLTISITNGIAAEKVQGRLGALKMNVGDRSASGDSTWLLDDPEQWASIRNHTDLTGDFAMGGADGGFYIDLCTVKIADGSPGLTRNASVTTKVSIMPEKDSELGYMIGFNRFPYLRLT